MQCVNDASYQATNCQFLVPGCELAALCSYTNSILTPVYTPYQSNRLPVGKHVLDVAVVLREHVLRDLVLGQPLEVLEVLDVGGQIGLTGHDAALHEEGLLTVRLGAGGLVDVGLAVFVDVVSGGVVADHPGVHVDTGGFGEGTLGGL